MFFHVILAKHPHFKSKFPAVCIENHLRVSRHWRSYTKAPIQERLAVGAETSEWVPRDSHSGIRHCDTNTNEIPSRSERRLLAVRKSWHCTN